MQKCIFIYKQTAKFILYYKKQLKCILSGVAASVLGISEEEEITVTDERAAQTDGWMENGVWMCW